MSNQKRIAEIEAELQAYRLGWISYDRAHVLQLQAERRSLLASIAA